MGWYSEQWQYRKKITVDSGKVDEALTDFPVYLDLSTLGADLFENAEDDGSDIVVTAADGETKLSRELVFISPQYEEGELYFKAPSLSSIADTEFYVYYGNAEASEQNETAVWSNGYEAVYHLQEAGDGTTGEYKDSTGNHPATGGTTSTSPNAPEQIEGVLGMAQQFNGSDEVIAAASHEYTPSEATIRAWVRADADGQSSLSTIFCSHRRTTCCLGVMALKYVPGDEFMFEADGHPSDMHRYYADEYSYTRGTWILLHGRWQSGENMELFIDNSLEVTGGPVDALAAHNTPLSIGAFTYDEASSDGDRRFEGAVDEARLENVRRSDAWIGAEYENESSPATFYSVGPEESLEVPDYEVRQVQVPVAIELAEYYRPALPTVVQKAVVGTNENYDAAPSTELPYSHPGGLLLVCIYYFEGEIFPNTSVTFGEQELVKHDSVLSAGDYEDQWCPAAELFAVEAEAASGDILVMYGGESVTRRGVMAVSVEGGSGEVRGTHTVAEAPGGGGTISVAVDSEDGDLILQFVAWRGSASDVVGYGSEQELVLQDDSPTRTDASSRNGLESETTMATTFSATDPTDTGTIGVALEGHASYEETLTVEGPAAVDVTDTHAQLEGYMIQRAVGTGEWEYITSVVGADADSWVDTGPFVDGQTYYYRIRQANNGLYSDWSDTVSVVWQETVIVGELLAVSAPVAVAVEDVLTPAGVHYEEMLVVGAAGRVGIIDTAASAEPLVIAAPGRVVLVDAMHFTTVLQIRGPTSVDVEEVAAASEQIAVRIALSVGVYERASLVEAVLVESAQQLDIVDAVAAHELCAAVLPVEPAIVDRMLFLEEIMVRGPTEAAVVDVSAAVETAAVVLPVEPTIVDRMRFLEEIMIREPTEIRLVDVFATAIALETLTIHSIRKMGGGN